MGLLIPEVFILLLTDTIFLLLMLYVLPAAWQIASSWDQSSHSQKQYTLEKKRLLISSIIRLAFLLKIPLFLFYIYTNDKMSNVLTGAMCAAGSVNATAYGPWLMYAKIANLFLMSAWLTAHRTCQTFEVLPHIRKKYTALIIITAMVAAEFALDLLNFYSIDPTAVVSCCSSIYSATSEDVSLLMTLKPFTVFYIFIGAAAAYLLAVWSRKVLAVFASASALFFAGVLNLILFTSTYIYELPSHKCPYCILQKEYGHIGYLFYISLFLGTVYAVSAFIQHLISKKYPSRYINFSVFFMILFVLLSMYFPVRYYLVNGVWL